MQLRRELKVKMVLPLQVFFFHSWFDCSVATLYRWNYSKCYWYEKRKERIGHCRSNYRDCWCCNYIGSGSLRLVTTINLFQEKQKTRLITGFSFILI